MASIITAPFRDSEAAATAPTSEGHRAPLCNVGPLANLMPVMQSLGFDYQRILAVAGFTPEQLQNSELRLPFHEASSLLAHCVRETGCPHLGLLLGQQGSPSQLGLPGFLVRTAPTVERALQVFADYLDLSDEAAHVKLDLDPELSSISYVVHVPDVEAIDHIYDMAMAMGCNIMRMLCGASWRPREVALQRQVPSELLPFRRFFNAPLRFNASESSITFSSHWLAHRAPTADELLHRHLEREAMELHEMHQMNLVDALPAVLSQGLLQDSFSAPEIAATLGIHERTLHRRLKESGTSFRRELDGIRFALSQQMLRSTRLTIEEIAASLGYASSSAFIRAFQRWTDTTPMRWRQQYLQH